MSVKELVLGGIRFELRDEATKRIKVTVSYGMNTISNELSMSQADMLRLYLTEHLK